jgi:diguanylate cyclase (GGDEF)-like protein
MEPKQTSFPPGQSTRLRLFVAVLMGLVLWPGLCTAADGQRHIVLQLRWHHQYQFAGYYMAKELGLYRDAGLDVEIRAGARGISPVTEVLEGRADFGIDGSGLLVERAHGRKVVALAAIFQKSPLRLIARADGDIRKITDLTGRKVMLLPGFRSLALIAMLDQVGLLDKIIRIDSSADIDDLINGNVDAFNGYNSNEPYALEEAGIPAVQFDPAAYGIQFYNDVLFTDQHHASHDPALVKAFRDASRRGWISALDNPEKAIGVILDRYTSGKSRAHLRFEANAMHESIMADVVEIGHMSPLRWEKIRDQLADLGLVPRGMSLASFVFSEPDEGLRWEDLQPYLLAGALGIALIFAAVAWVIRKNVQLQDQVDERISAEQKANHLATHDYLTGLPNRMLLMDRLQGALARARRHNQTPLLAFIDLDRFKLLNDRHGHECGDRLLTAVARQVELVTRDEDTFARMGGDEFVLLIDHMPVDRAAREAERLALAVRSANASLQTDVQVTASIGILTVVDPRDLTPDQALRMADDLMYEVKRGAKNGYLIRACEGNTKPDTIGPAEQRHARG